MSRSSTSTQVLSASVLSAILASWCCILPLIALLVGGSTSALNAKWIEPFRPYMIGTCFLALSFSWIQHFISKNTTQDCCQTNSKPGFLKTKTFLVLMTLFALSSLTFPLYSNILFEKSNTQLSQYQGNQKIELQISGMTCTGCENHIEHAIGELPGVIEVNASYENGITNVSYDSLLVGLPQFEEAIKSIDYQIIHSKHAK
jgi:mercuric ion transport protein